MDTPSSLDIFQPESRMQRKTRRSMVNRRMMEQPRPLLLTDTGSRLCTSVNRNHGNGNLIARFFLTVQRRDKYILISGLALHIEEYK